MIATLSQLFLSLAFVLCAYSAWAGFRSVRGVYSHGLSACACESSIRVSTVLLGLVGLSFLGLISAFVWSDFSVRNVAENSNLALPAAFRVAASWGSHEGSFLLWVLMVAGWTAALAHSRFQVSDCFKVRVLSTLHLLQLSFIAYLLFASNPFELLNPAPFNGRDLNPLLQDWVMIAHPPMLYMGYVGFSVIFACAIAGLLEGRFDMTWARWARPWCNAAWACLTLGIALGSWWAYRELGWGGWWFWDPVENASLMPWLAGTALIHSLAVSEKRGALRSWTLLLALSTFALSLLGTFLVRSGVLTSVHAFATDPERGVFILIILLLVLGSAYMLYAWKAAAIQGGPAFKWTGRESLLMSNNILMVSALFMVMLGTLYPLAVELLNGRKMSVGQPYFEAMIAPLLLPAVFLMGLGPGSRWIQTSLGQWVSPALWMFGLFCLLLGPMLWWQLDWGVALILSLFCASFLTFCTVIHGLGMLRAVAKGRVEWGLWHRMRSLSGSYWGMALAHFGVAVFVVGVASVNTFQTEADAVLSPGQTQSIGPWRITFIGVDGTQGPNYQSSLGVFELTRGDGRLIHLLEPEKRHYPSTQQTMTEAAIHTDWLSDVYVSLGEPQPTVQGVAPGAWGVRLYYKPLINLIWLGCILMACGGLLSVLDKRYRVRKATSKHTDPLEPKAAH